LDAGSRFKDSTVIKIQSNRVSASQAAARKGHIHIGVYVPNSHGDYRFLAEAYSGEVPEPTMLLDEYLQAVGIAGQISKGSPHCDKATG
jgi:hypothetical protein